ncbi:MAG: 4-(cytidine 5'-diphospho)-2-C-methyl-D-erythritol kinase [Candidatus Eisenbacteria bacterium]|nr:4-(cytidine 5'-diphospho)-2-C-methyl-D-erythritol kinase [Candidatus Eisenbacteria bacterium]
MKICLESYAKVNLFLEVLGERTDGYHEIETVMQSVSIRDRIDMEEKEEGIEVVAEGAGVPSGEENLAHRAATLLRREAGVRAGCSIRIRKGIPAAAGLGGGSGDAAAVLAGLHRLWRLDWPRERLAALGATIGSDVPFFLWGGAALCTGRGEIVEPLPSLSQRHRFLIVTPPFQVSTRFIYNELNRYALTRPKVWSKVKCVHGLGSDPECMLHRLWNRLEEVAFSARPSLREWADRMERLGCSRVLLSGSGPTLFGLLPRGERDEIGILSRFPDSRHASIAHPTTTGYRFMR